MPELLPAAGGWRNVEYGYNSRGPYVFGVLGTKHMDEMQMRDVVEHTNFGVGSVLLSWEQDPVDSVIVAVREVLERHWTSASLPVAPDVQDSFGMALKAMVDVGGVMGARLQSESGAHLLLMGSDRRLLAMAALRPDEMLDDLPFDEIGYHIPLLG